MTLPDDMIRGGQGRTPDDVASDGMVVAAIMALILFAVFAALLCGAVAAVVS